MADIVNLHRCNHVSIVDLLATNRYPANQIYQFSGDQSIVFNQMEISLEDTHIG